MTNRFQWRQIESTNYKTYVAGLRRIGCPEKTLDDIIIAEVIGISRLASARHTWKCPSGRAAGKTASRTPLTPFVAQTRRPWIN